MCRFSSDLYLYADGADAAHKYEPIGPYTPDVEQYCNYVTIDGLNFDPTNMMFYVPTERIAEASSKL